MPGHAVRQGATLASTIHQAVILAAGRGKRLHPLTLTRSKAMAPVAGKPIVERVMDSLFAHGTDRFVLVISPDDEELVRYFEHESQIGAVVSFAYQTERLGMADALHRATSLIDGPFVLSACDNLISAQDMGRFMTACREASHLHAVLALMPVDPEQVSKGGVVEMDGQWITRIVEKPSPKEAPSNIYSLPLYCFSPRILDYLTQVPRSPRGEYELQDAIQMLIDRDGRVTGVTVPHRLTLTTPQDLLALNCHYLSREGDPIQAAGGSTGADARLIPPLRIEPGSVVGRGCTLGPNLYVESSCHIGDGVTLRDAVLLRGSTIPDGATVQNQVIAPP